MEECARTIDGCTSHTDVYQQQARADLRRADRAKGTIVNVTNDDTAFIALSDVICMNLTLLVNSPSTENEIGS